MKQVSEEKNVLKIVIQTQFSIVKGLKTGIACELKKYFVSYGFNMKKILFTVKLVCIGFLGMSQIDLRLNLSIDSTYYATSHLSTTVIETFLGVHDTTITTYDGQMAFTVVGKLDSFYLMKMKFLSVKQGSRNGTDSSFISSDDLDTSITQNLVLKLMINRPVDIKMNEIGDIIELKNSDNLFLDALKRFHLSETKKQELLKQIRAIMESDISDGGMDLVTSMYPNKPVEIEEPWEVFSKSNTSVPSTSKTVYELKQVNDSSYLIKGSGNLTTDTSEVVSDGKAMKFHLTGTVNSTAVIDKANNWIGNANINQVLVGIVEVKDQQTANADAVPIPMKIINEVSFKGTQ